MAKIQFATDLSEYLGNVEEGSEEIAIEFPVFREGEFDHPWYDRLVFDANYLHKIVDNHRAQAFSSKVSLDVSHRPEDGAYGWVEDVNDLSIREATVKTPYSQRQVNMLFARFTLNKLGIEAIKNKVFRYCSAEIHSDYTNYEIMKGIDGSESVKKWGPTLLGVALTNRPFINSLGEISLSSDLVQHSEDDKVYLSCNKGPGVIFVEVEKPNNGAASADDSTEENLKFDNIPKGVEEEVTQNGEGRMKFTELVKDLKKFSNVEEQLEHLKANRHKVSEEEVDSFDLLLQAKEEALQAKISLSEASHRKKMAEDAAERLRSENAKLNMDLSEAKEGSWSYRVQAYCEKLRTEDHYEAVIGKVESLLSSLKPESRDLKFSTVDGENPFDVISIVSEILDAIPSDARMNFSELSSANEGVEVTPDPAKLPQVPAQAQSVDGEDGDVIPDKILKYSKNHGHVPLESIWDKIDENGFLNLDLSN